MLQHQENGNKFPSMFAAGSDEWEAVKQRKFPSWRSRCNGDEAKTRYSLRGNSKLSIAVRAILSVALTSRKFEEISLKLREPPPWILQIARKLSSLLSWVAKVACIRVTHVNDIHIVVVCNILLNCWQNNGHSSPRLELLMTFKNLGE
jgi:hypothetical protein